jgi:hypothetical protein
MQTCGYMCLCGRMRRIYRPYSASPTKLRFAPFVPHLSLGISSAFSGFWCLTARCHATRLTGPPLHRHLAIIIACFDALMCMGQTLGMQGPCFWMHVPRLGPSLARANLPRHPGSREINKTHFPVVWLTRDAITRWQAKKWLLWCCPDARTRK